MELSAQPLSKADFAPFGEVIETRGQGAKRIAINDGLTTRFHDLFTIDMADGGRPIVSLFRTAPVPLPHRVRALERHPLGSQAFIPLDDLPFLVLVAAPTASVGDPIAPADLRLFRTNGRQGVNLHRNTWHHFHIVLERQRDFLIVDHGHGNRDNLQEARVQGEAWIPDTA